MPNRHKSVEELSAVIKRIADGEGYIQRLEELVDRATVRGEDTQHLRDYLDEMHVIQRSFRETRDVLGEALRATGHPPASGEGN